MGYRVKYLDEIKDSRLLYEKKVPAFGFIIILIVTAFMIALGVWAYKTPKVSVVKATGTISSSKKNYVMSPYTGQILKADYEEGKVVKEGDVLFTIKSTDLELQLQQLTSNKELLEKKIELYKKYVQSLEAENNMFNSSDELESPFYNKYEAYINQTKQVTVNEDMLKAYGYSKDDIDKEYEKADDKVKQIYYTELNSANDSIAELTSQVETIDIQIQAINNGISEYEVKAPNSGVIHIMEKFTEGMIIQTGQKVASIATNEDDFEIIATVSEADATKINKGDKVDIAISGLTQSVYGTISGKIIAKDTDVSISQTNTGAISYFKLKIKPDYDYVISKAGDKVNLSNGMSVETRIRYDKVTYFNYVLDALGLV